MVFPCTLLLYIILLKIGLHKHKCLILYLRYFIKMQSQIIIQLVHTTFCKARRINIFPSGNICHHNIEFSMAKKNIESKGYMRVIFKTILYIENLCVPGECTFGRVSTKESQKKHSRAASGQHVCSSPEWLKEFYTTPT